MATHLGVPLKRIINLVSPQLYNDNNSQPFYFDNDTGSLFAMPRGYSFVITDIFIHPTVFEFHPAQFFLLLISVDGIRDLVLRCDGHGKHIALRSGLVVPGNHRRVAGVRRLTCLNSSSSTNSVYLQVMGYLINEKGLGIGDVFTP